MCTEPVLGLADNEGTFHLDTDAWKLPFREPYTRSRNGGDGKILRPISLYASRLLNTTEQKYGASKAKMLAVVYFRGEIPFFLSRPEDLC